MRFGVSSSGEPSRKREVSAGVPCITMQPRLWIGLNCGAQIQGDEAGMT